MIHSCPHPVCRCFDSWNESWKKMNAPGLPYKIQMQIDPMSEPMSQPGQRSEPDWFIGTVTWSDNDGMRTFSTSAQGLVVVLDLLKVGLLEFASAIEAAEERKKKNAK